MIRGIFFDLYGTLFLYGDMKQAWNVWLSTFYKCMRDLGLSITIEDFSSACDQFFGREEPKNPDSEMTLLENRINELVHNYRLLASKRDIKEIADIIVASWQDFIELDPDTIPVLENLSRNYIIGLVSNFDHPRHVRKCLSEYRLDNFLDTIVVSAEVGVKKPDPKIFDKALKDTNIRATEVIYIGDTADDITAAKAADMHSVLIQRKVRGTDVNALDFTDNKSHRMEKPKIQTHTISSLPELIPLIEQLHKANRQ